jgi:MoxR-like ATPase
VQFTPDLLPSDIAGSLIFNSKTEEFFFRPGPVFANVVLADEINRASPKTQSALLEVMEERQVTVDGTPYVVPSPFVVIATQNPIEHDGTYDLPYGQMDRFAVRTPIGYPDHVAEVQVLEGRVAGRTVDQVKPVMDIKTAQTMSAIARDTYVAPPVMDYIVSLCNATRRLGELRVGVSPRGSLSLVTVSQAYAAAQRREFVTVDDVKAVASYVLAHRMMLTTEAELAGQTAESLLKQILTAVPVPEARAG